jgi:hypothetical protein
LLFVTQIGKIDQHRKMTKKKADAKSSDKKGGDKKGAQPAKKAEPKTIKEVKARHILCEVRQSIS